jgi:purine-binding chemotaxis protein CheW
MSELALLFRATATTFAALPAAHVVETMRPLPCEAIAGAPDFVLGAAVIRGVPTPIVSVGALLRSDGDDEPAKRWITVRVGARIVGLAVPDVVGVRRLPSGVASSTTPPLLTAAVRGAASTLSVLDGALLVVLETARLISDDVWAAVGGTRAPSNEVRGAS